ncbi:MAG TPA: S8 family serine peptidase [Rhizomicrobium sp.]
MNDFRPKPQYTKQGPGSCEPFDANGNENSTCYWVVPADLWTIYNFPVSTYNGAGQTIVVMEDVDPCCTGNPSQDWCNFRVTFVEQSCSSSLFSLVSPYKAHSNEHTCTNPSGGSSYIFDEAALDPQWASAAAPGANIVVATCADSGSTLPGYLIALQNYVDIYSQQIISISYGECEADLGAGGNSVLNATYQQAAAEGFSIFVAAGDGGPADCDYTDTSGYATQGITVSGYASSPYVVAVGGTTFGDWALGNPSSYWSAQNEPYWGSAQSYIPEIAWNSSCGNVLLALYYTQQQQTYGPAGFCNNSKYLNPPYPFLIVLGGSGGPSSCAEGFNPPDGGCVGYPKPSWQSGILSNPADNVRDVPDVSIFAGGPEWGHALVYCNSSNLGGKEACTDPLNIWSSGSGTSYSAPIFAGIQALIDQHDGGQVGNPNAIYYTLAKEEYGQYGNSNCLSVKAKAGNNCVFYDISDLTSSGDSTTVVPCGPNSVGQVIDCFLDGATNGVLSTNDSAYDPAYASQLGWDFTTGIGTPNVTNLINAWPAP